MAYVGLNPKFNTVRYVPQSADPTNPTEGQVFRSDGTVRAKGLWEYRDGSWKSVGTGTGSPDTICLVDADNYGSTSAFATGDGTITAGAELPGGTLQGTFSLQTGSVVEGVNSWRYIQAAGSLDSYIFSDVQTIDPAFRGKDVGVNIIAKYDGSDNDILFIVWDETNNQILTQTDFYVKYSTTFKNYQTVFTIPSTCTQVRIGLQVKVLNSGKQLDWDMMSIFDRPFVMANINDNHNIVLKGASNTGSGYMQFTTLVREKGSGILLNELTSSNRKITALRKCTGVATSSFNTNPNTGNIKIEHYNSSNTLLFEAWGGENDTGSFGISTYAFTMEVGDYLKSYCSSASHGTFGDGETFSISADAQVESVITPSKVMDPVTYTRTTAQSIPTGTDTIVDFATSVSDYESHVTTGASWKFTAKRSGWYTTDGHLTWGATSFSAGVTVTVKLHKNGVETYTKTEIIPAAKQYFQFDLDFASVYLNAGDYLDIRVSQNTGSSQSLLAAGAYNVIQIKMEGSYPLVATPVDRVCYLKDVQTSGTNGGTFTAGSDQTRVLNTIEGDTSFCSLLSNQFTVSPGTYDYDFEAPAYIVGKHRALLYNVTGASVTMYGSAEHTLVASAVVTKSRVRGRVTVTSQTTFELRHRCENTAATVGLGVNSGYGSEVYAQGSIKKIK